MTVRRRRPSWWFSRNELSGEPGAVQSMSWRPVGARQGGHEPSELPASVILPELCVGWLALLLDQAGPLQRLSTTQAEAYGPRAGASKSMDCSPATARCWRAPWSMWRTHRLSYRRFASEASERASPSSRPPAAPVASTNSAPAPFAACVLCFFAVLLFMAAPWSRPVDRLVLADPMLRPTRVRPLLSSRVQQRQEGHP
jgi:hypothetical protein